MGDHTDDHGMTIACGPPQNDARSLVEAEARGFRAGVESVKRAVLDIDAHATGLAQDDDGFVTGGYIISVGSLHRALGVVGHTAPQCKTCRPETHDCEGV